MSPTHLEYAICFRIHQTKCLTHTTSMYPIWPRLLKRLNMIHRPQLNWFICLFLPHKLALVALFSALLKLNYVSGNINYLSTAEK